MKKSIFAIAAILCMAFVAPVPAFADGAQVDLQVSLINIDPGTIKGGPHKAPPRVPSTLFPSVFLDGSTLFFTPPYSSCTVQLLDENGDVVFSVFVPTGTMQVELPEDISGCYRLQIIRGRFCFWGWIEL